MATSPGGACADVISQDKVRELCPEEFEAFLVSLREDEEVSEEVFDDTDEERLQYVADQYLKFDTHDGCPVEIEAAWWALKVRFAEVTKDPHAYGGTSHGLTLFLNTHESQSEHDGVDGVFWEVGGMYELTPAGRKCEGFIERKYYVQWC